MRKRNIRVQLWLNKKEVEALDKRVKKSRLSREAYLRHLINGVVPRDAPPPDYFSMMRELHGIGNNLKDISVRPPKKERFVRLARNFGEEYTMESIRRRILTQSRPERLLPEPVKPAKRYRVSGNLKTARKITGFRALYFHYCYLLGIFPKNRPRQNKRNAYPCAITQNVEYLLDDLQASTMLSNSEFIGMLNQAASDREKLSQLLNISPEQMSYVTGADAGCGLMRYGNSLVPFINRFPRNTELYKLITTKPGEGIFGDEAAEQPAPAEAPKKKPAQKKSPAKKTATTRKTAQKKATDSEGGAQ